MDRFENSRDQEARGVLYLRAEKRLSRARRMEKRVRLITGSKFNWVPRSTLLLVRIIIGLRRCLLSCLADFWAWDSLRGLLLTGPGWLACCFRVLSCLCAFCCTALNRSGGQTLISLDLAAEFISLALSTFLGNLLEPLHCFLDKRICWFFRLVCHCVNHIVKTTTSIKG